MARQLSDLGCPIPESMVVMKILCSLPPSFNTIGSAWDNLPTEMQTVHNLTVRLLKQETVNKMQGAGNVEFDHAFFSKTQPASSSSQGRSNQKKEGSYIDDLKRRTKCSICKEKGHWWKECPNKHKFPNAAKGKTSNDAQSTVNVSSTEPDTRALAIQSGHYCSSMSNRCAMSAHC
jgi:hypothetical protein